MAEIKSENGVASSVKIGAVLSYILMFTNALFGLVVTPLILKSIGESSYGVYKTITSFSSAMMVLDFGLGGTTIRYIAKYRSDKREDKIQPFVSMSLLEAGILMSIVAAVAVAIYYNISNIYSESFVSSEINLAKDLFFVLSIATVLNIFENVFNGIISGYNNFTLANGLKLVRLLTRLILYLILLPIFKSALILVNIDLIITIILLLTEIIYVRMKYNLKSVISFKTWDKQVFKESFFYSFMLFLTSIAAQINNNLDNVVIGVIKGADFVAVYSFGLLLFGMFEQLSTAISGVMLPTITQALKKKNGIAEVQNLIIGAGRIQFALLGAAIAGFFVVGKEFIFLWLGAGYEDVYLIGLILMIPAAFELCVNVCLSVLRAKNMLGFRTGVLFISTVLNFVVTVVGVKYFNYKAAAVGTALSFIIGSLLIMNIYYYKKFGFNMLKIYKAILGKIWICILIGGTALFISSRIFKGGWIAFLVNVAIFCAVYTAALFLFGLTKQEKKSFLSLNILGKLKSLCKGKEKNN